MDPIAIQIGPIAIRYYGLMYVLAFFVGGWLLGREVRRKGIPLTDTQRWDFLALVYIGGLLGARLYYVAFNWPYYSQQPLEIFKIWHGGLAIHGGLLGGLLGGWWYVARHRLPFLQLADAGVSSVILGATSVEQLRENLGSLDLRLSKEQMQRLDSVSAPYVGYPYDFISTFVPGG